MMLVKPEQDGEEDYDIFKQEYSSLAVAEENAPKPNPALPAQKLRRSKQKRRLLLIAVALVVLLFVIGGISKLLKRSAPKTPPTVIINTQSLDNGTLNQLTVEAGGTGKQQLTISPDTLFENNVTINKDLTVKGQTVLQSGVSVGRDLAIGGNTGIGGNLNVTGQISAGNLNVGSVTISSLRLSGDLEFTGHLMPTGAAPTIKSAPAASGGTVVIDGNDTNGTITITVGSNPIIGQMAVITFRAAYTGTPKVQLTPVSAAAAKLDYFVARSAGFFTIEAASAPVAGETYVFDYLVTD